MMTLSAGPNKCEEYIFSKHVHTSANVSSTLRFNFVDSAHPNFYHRISMNQIKALGSDVMMSGPLRPQMYEGLFDFFVS